MLIAWSIAALQVCAGVYLGIRAARLQRYLAESDARENARFVEFKAQERAKIRARMVGTR